MSPRAVTEILVHVAVIAGLIAGARVGFLAGNPYGDVPLLWLPPGIALAACLLGGFRIAPAVAIGCFLGLRTSPLFGNDGALAVGVGTALVAAGIADLARRLLVDPRLERASDVGWLLIGAIPLVAMLDGAVTMLASDVVHTKVPGVGWFSQWASWTLSSAVGATLVTPTLLLALVLRGRLIPARRLPEFTGLTLAMIAATVARLFLPTSDSAVGPVATVIALPLAVALALRFDRVGAAVAGMVATLGVVIGAVAGEGPFSRELVAEALPAIFGLWALTLALQTVALLLGVAVAANRRQTAEIEAVNARLRQVVDAARLGYWQFDADWRTTHANPRLAAMLGSNVAGLLGRSILDLVPDRAGPEARQRLDAALRGEHEGDVELEFTRGDGGTSWLSLHVTPLLAPRSLRTRRGLGGGAIAAVEDIGERRRGEAQRLRLETNILHAQKLESLGVLASGLAHDFNNIVMSIRGNAELLRRGRGGEPPVEWVRSGAERIDQACDRAAALVATLMAYAGKGEFVVERVGISRAIREAVEVARLAAPRNAVLVFEPPAAELAVDADPQYLRQLLVSILSNAVEALRSEGGTVRVGWQATAPHGASVPESIEIAVSDDGVGMGRELQARAFEPFFTTKGLGRGLGLSSALGIAHRLGGSIEIESASGLGTTVRVRLPVASPDPIESAAPGRSAEVAARRPVALLVEPLPAARDLAIVALELRGFSVAEERDLDAAIREARRRPVGLLVADVGASILVAVDALRAARNDGFDVPIVLSSERRDTEVLMPGDDRTLWIPRPFGVRELLDAVDSLQRPTRREREARAALATWTSMAGL